MSRISINRNHDLDEDQCWELAQDLMGQLVDHYGGSIKQEEDCLRYRHASGMKAKVLPQHGELAIDVSLNLLTRKFAPEIEKEINQVLDKYLA